MKTLHHLALLALFAVAGTTAAQTPPPVDPKVEKKVEATGVQAALKGTWMCPTATDGDVFGLVFDGEGAAAVGLLDGDPVTGKSVFRKGKCTITGDVLTITHEKGKEGFCFTLEEDKLTLSYKRNGNSVWQEFKRKK